jgi:hypothetical protein
VKADKPKRPPAIKHARIPDERYEALRVLSQDPAATLRRLRKPEERDNPGTAKSEQ